MYIEKYNGTFLIFSQNANTRNLYCDEIDNPDEPMRIPLGVL